MNTSAHRFIAYAVPATLDRRDPIGAFSSKAAAVRAARTALAAGAWQARIERQEFTWVSDAEWNETQQWVGSDTWTLRSA